MLPSLNRFPRVGPRRQLGTQREFLPARMGTVETTGTRPAPEISNRVATEPRPSRWFPPSSQRFPRPSRQFSHPSWQFPHPSRSFVRLTRSFSRPSRPFARLTRRFSRLAVVPALFLAVTLTGCTGASDPTPHLTVFAAASLTTTLPDIARDFEAATNSTVTLQFDGSATLARQIVAGAPADVFAAADATTLATVQSAGLAGTPTVFATNDLRLAVPAANPARIHSLADLANPGLTVLACTPDQPCGDLAHRVWTAAGLTLYPASYEPSATAVVTKLTLGEADAGFVYATDLFASPGRLLDIPLPESVRPVARTQYFVATIGPPSDLATAFVAFLTTPAAQARLAQAGFGLP